MNHFKEHNNIRIGDTVFVKQLFDVDPDNGNFSQVLEIREGTVVDIHDLDSSLFGITYDVEYGNGRAHGANINQLRPDGSLLVIGHELLSTPKGPIGNTGPVGDEGQPGISDGSLYVYDHEILERQD